MFAKPVDLHMHTCYSHGLHTPWEMHVAAQNRGLELIGFTEHSPRPLGYDYTHEYREHLSRNFDRYINEVRALKKRGQETGGCQVLLGLEMDWLRDQTAFIQNACRAHDYDYLIGSVHFIGHWGFDDASLPWEKADREQCFVWYEQYFSIWRDMLASGLFQIAAHPDLIKIFSNSIFHEWLKNPHSLDMVGECLKTLSASGMAMEISSAGLRKPCREIYPCPEIMAIAADLGLSITFASDAHNMRDVGADFDQIMAYAKSFGFGRQSVFMRGEVHYIPF